MTAARERRRIMAQELSEIADLAPLAGVGSLGGARVYAIGQGDAIAVMDSDLKPVLQIDYGGHQGNPFSALETAERARVIDSTMPVPERSLIMITHWDQDHWCSAPKGEEARKRQWLVPRQVTSPRATEFAAGLDHISCIPEALVGQPCCFKARNGDELWWEKIGPSQTSADKYEDCNRSGVAFSLVRRRWFGRGEVILLPGDAPFASVAHYRQHLQAQLTLTGLVAFHHGADTHWSEATRALLRNWRRTREQVDVVFSCGKDNSYSHPHEANYRALFGPAMRGRRTDRAVPGSHLDLLFAG